MVQKRSIKALEREIEIEKAIVAIKAGQFKSVHAAAKALKLLKESLRCRLNGVHTRAEARQKQQLLSKNQEQTLLKWIKGLTLSGYAPSHRILREVAEEVRSNKYPIKPTGPAADPTDPTDSIEPANSTTTTTTNTQITAWARLGAMVHSKASYTTC
ncbi:hypothetical protein V494_03129 [Pseudogymnoascus sp. VKM F-4513 (FW-928)]|nr:hypothetical protein V494_03129 [Pseudogymnoascus sp. VKM F-4513 (FW-928)]